MDAELYELLTELGRAGYLIQSYQADWAGPEIVTGVLRRGDCADVLVLRDEQTAHGWRTPVGDGGTSWTRAPCTGRSPKPRRAS